MAAQEWLKRLAHLSLADVGSSLKSRLYQSIYDEVRGELLTALRNKDFGDIGPAEIINSDRHIFDNSRNETSNELAALYEVHLWIQTCVSLVAQSLPLAPLRFYRAVGFSEGREELEPWDEHPANQLFRWVNPHMDPFAFWEWQTAFLQLTGMSYVAKVPASEGAPEGVEWDLYPLFPAFVRKVVTNSDGITQYVYRVQGEDEIVLDSSDVLYLRTFSPTDRFNGQGLLHSGRQTVLTDLRAQRFNDELLKNGVYLHGTLETEDDIATEDAEAMRDIFVSKYGGQSNAAKVAVLWSGMKFQPHQIAHQDIQWIDQRRMSQEEIAIAHGIPLELLGIKSANFATLREKRKIFWQDTVQRWGTRIESQLNSTGLPLLFPGETDLRCGFDYSKIDALQQDILDIVKAGDIAIRSGQVTPDEWRQAQLSLPPLGGASELQFIGSKPIESLVAESAARIESQRARARVSAPTDDDEDNDAPPRRNNDSDDDEQERRLHLGRVAPRIARVVSQPMLSGVRTKSDAEWRALWERISERHEKRLGVEWRKLSRELQREVTKAVGSQSTIGHRELTRMVEHIFVGEGPKVAQSVAQEVLEAGMNRWSKHVAGQAGIGNIFNLDDEVARGYIRRRAPFYRDHFGHYGKRLSRTLSSALSEGLTERQLARKMDGWFTDYRNQSQAIARTEVNSALNFSGNEAMRTAFKEGVNVRSRWVTMDDGRVRQGVDSLYDHASADGLEIIPGSDVFVVSGESLEYPGDSSNGASVGNIVNCRCTTRPVVKDFN